MCTNTLLLLQLTSHASSVQRESRSGPVVPFLMRTHAQQAGNIWALPEKRSPDLTNEHTNMDTPYA